MSDKVGELMTVKQAAEYIGVGQEQIYGWMKRPPHTRLPYVLVGKDKRVVKAAVTDWLMAEAARS